MRDIALLEMVAPMKVSLNFKQVPAEPDEIGSQLLYQIYIKAGQTLNPRRSWNRPRTFFALFHNDYVIFLMNIEFSKHIIFHSDVIIMLKK